MMMGECLTILEFSLIYPSLPKPTKIKNDIFFITKSFIFNKEVFFIHNAVTNSFKSFEEKIEQSIITN